MKDAAEGLELPQGIQGANLETGLACAMISDNGRARALADRLDKRYLLDTQVQSLWLPPFVRN